VKLAQTLLDRNVRVCGTMSASRGIPRDLSGKAGSWKMRSQHSRGMVT